ncbi:hypothetical protein [Staphylococcus aureus]
MTQTPSPDAPTGSETASASGPPSDGLINDGSTVGKYPSQNAPI